MKPFLKDALLKSTIALPTGASSVTSAAIDLGQANADFAAPVEFLISAPLLVVGKLADASTMKYAIVHSDNSDLSSPTTIAPDLIIQTGAGGAGAAAATFRWRPASDVKRYIGLKVTNSAAADASAVSATLEAMF